MCIYLSIIIFLSIWKLLVLIKNIEINRELISFDNNNEQIYLPNYIIHSHLFKKGINFHTQMQNSTVKDFEVIKKLG